MSEFTDFFAVQTEAATLEAFRGRLEQSVGGAYVPLDELPFGALDSEQTMAQAWAALPKPVWIKLGLSYQPEVDALVALSAVGPAVKILVEEDFSTWGLRVSCGQETFAVAVLRAPGQYREATDLMPVYEQKMQTGGIAACLGLDDPTFRATMIPDGGESFSVAVGIKYEQMLDMTMDEPKVGEYIFGY